MKKLNIAILTSKKTKIKYTIVAILCNCIGLVYPIFLMYFVNNVVDHNGERALIFAMLTFIAFVINQVAYYCYSIMVGRVEEENYLLYYEKLSKIVSNHRKDDKDFDEQEINQFMGQYYDQSNAFFFLKKIELIISIIFIVAIYTIMFVLDWRIGLGLLFVIPLTFFFSKKFQKKLSANSEKNIHSLGRIKKYINDENHLRKVECFEGEKQLKGINPLFDIFRLNYRGSVKDKSAYLYFFSYSILNLAILLSMIAAGYFAFNYLLPIGTLFAFQNYTSLLWNPCETIIYYNADHQAVKPLLSKIENLFSSKQDTLSSAKVNTVKIINFVSLDYENKPLFNPISYEFNKNNIYLIKGKNGSGKTTLIEAIMGFNSRYRGEILFNDKMTNPNDFTYIAAEPYISEFYEEEKSNGSNGEKKLEQLSLYLKKPNSIVILDEPTNFVDKKNKEYVRELILKLKDRIVIVISHDPYLDDLTISSNVIKL
ncbi:MAG: ABC transporter ATP-binding protein [Bacteroidales bacterium]|jgi:ABC-type multidrug transport system fused ATPase/permease subunit